MNPDQYQALEVFEGEDKQHYWHVKAGNGDVVATGGQGYSTRAGAYRGFAAATRVIVDLAGSRLQAHAEEEASNLEQEAQERPEPTPEEA